MKLFCAVLLVAVMLAAAGSATERTAEAAPSISLSPDSGDAPSETGSITGFGWECSPGVVPSTTATVSGSGVSGSATLGRGGSLSGDFTVSGRPGDIIDITVTATMACPALVPIVLQATAVFTFHDAPPTPTRTKTPTVEPSSTIAPLPTSTPPSPVAPPLTPTTPPTAAAPTTTQATATTAPTVGPAPVQPAGTQTVLFAGCEPSSPVSLEFVPLYILGAEPPSDTPTGPSVVVPAVQTGGDAPGFAFEPPAANPGRLFRVSPKSNDPGCGAQDQSSADYWIAGQTLVVPMEFSGQTHLDVCALGDKQPCEYPLVKGIFIERGAPLRQPGRVDALLAQDGWVTDKDFYPEDLKKGKFRFRSSTDVTESGPARLQASVLPYSAKAEDDSLAPQGLVASWDIECVNCEFTVDLSMLAPEEPPEKEAWYEKVIDLIAKPFKLVAQGAWTVITWIGGLVGGGGDSSDEISAVQVSPETALPGEQLIAAALAKLPQPTTYYIRLLPLDKQDKSVLGPPSNPVRLQEVDKPPAIKVPGATPTVQAKPPAYQVEILTYHGIIPPQVPNKICYIATEDAWPLDLFGWQYTTDSNKAVSSVASPVKKGQPICKPTPQEPSLIEAILSWAEYTVDWASGAWSDLKEFAVDVILKYTPLGMQCGIAEDAGAIPAGTCASAFAIALDAALVSLGIPPDIPNFDQLVDQGIEYLAAELAAQVAIPPDVVQAAIAQGGPYAGLALSVAEDKLREELQNAIEAKLGDAAKSIALGYAASVAWVPDGIPVRPDDYQAPGMALRVTRKAGIAGGEAGCAVRVSDSLKLSQDAVLNPPPEWASFVKGLPQALTSLNPYDLFVNEAGTADKELFVPPLPAGQSYTIPMTFKPNYYKSGWSPNGLIKVSDYIGVWRYLHDVGTIHLDASGTCGSDTMDLPASAILAAMDIVGQQ
jgi:hypothetical protein